MLDALLPSCKLAMHISILKVLPSPASCRSVLFPSILGHRLQVVAVNVASASVPAVLWRKLHEQVHVCFPPEPFPAPTDPDSPWLQGAAQHTSPPWHPVTPEPPGLGQEGEEEKLRQRAGVRRVWSWGR